MFTMKEKPAKYDRDAVTEAQAYFLRCAKAHQPPSEVPETKANSFSPMSSVKSCFPRIAFSVVYKAHKNAVYGVYVCGNIPELGNTVFPQRILQRGIPLLEDPDGEDRTDYWRTEFIPINVSEPGTRVHYTYYVLLMDNATNNNLNDKAQPALFAVEIFPHSAADPSLPLGLRSFVIPKPALRNNMPASEKRKKQYFYIIDQRFKTLDKPSRVVLASLIDDV